MAGDAANSIGIGWEMVAMGPLKSARGDVSVWSIHRPEVPAVSRAVTVVATQRRFRSAGPHNHDRQQQAPYRG